MASPIKQFELTDRAALITGGTKGLGRAMAEGLASAGAKVAIASRNQEQCTAVAREIAEAYSVKTVGIEDDARPDADAEEARTVSLRT